jgi:hypothetical protein
MIRFRHGKTNNPNGFDLGRGATFGWPLLFEIGQNENIRALKKHIPNKGGELWQA